MKHSRRALLAAIQKLQRTLDAHHKPSNDEVQTWDEWMAETEEMITRRRAEKTNL